MTGATGEAADEVRVLVPDIETLARRLAGVDYLVDERLATAMFLGARLPQPLLLEGEAGVGKTRGGQGARRRARHPADPAAVLRGDRRRRGALRVELPAPAAEHPAGRRAAARTLREEDLFGPDYLIRRPLLRALEHPGPRPAVLLIDEIDRADDDFEAFLLELLGEASVTIPEIGTIAATHPPVIVLTSNRTRDLHDAVKRRCLYHWIDYPDPRARGRDRPPPRAGRLPGAGGAGGRRGGADARERRAEAAGHRRGHRLARGARACSASSGWTPPRPTAPSARCSSTARTRRWSARRASSTLVAGRD